jgi:hypothetical protein
VNLLWRYFDLATSSIKSTNQTTTMKPVFAAISSFSKDIISFLPPGLVVFFATGFISDGQYLKQFRHEFLGTSVMMVNLNRIAELLSLVVDGGADRSCFLVNQKSLTPFLLIRQLVDDCLHVFSW